ncbi:MAG: DUF4147 domain-containing protein [bacterium]|nr:DUF4147 domain-containing protein [bacterium]
MVKNKDVLLKMENATTFYHTRKALIEAVDFAFEKTNIETIFENRINKIGKKPYGISIGKAAHTMLKALTKIIEIEGGILITNIKLTEKFEKIRCFRGGHPYPNRESVKSARYLLNVLQAGPPGEPVLLISGGGSSMLELPRTPLRDLVKINKLLLSCGANIEEINTVRKHLSLIKGGQLIKYLNKKSYAFLMSDVVNDRIDLIASGLTTCDPSTFRDAFEVLKKYGIWDCAPKSVKRIITEGLNGKIPETLKDCKLAMEKIENTIILKNSDFLLQLEKFLKSLGYVVLNLGSDFHIEIEEMVETFLNKVKEIKAEKPQKPVAIVAGGEVSLKVIGKGKGGRNQELAIRMAIELSKTKEKFVFTSIGTDGIDGITYAAGAICDSETIKKAKILNLEPEKYLKDNDSFSFFKKIGGLIYTGPTGINVKDVYCLVLINEQNSIYTL